MIYLSGEVLIEFLSAFETHSIVIGNNDENKFEG